MDTTAIDTSTRARAGDEVVPDRPRRRGLSRRARNILLTAHIALSVGLLGDSAGYLAVAIRTSTLDDPALVQDSVRTLNMFSLVFGIPLSFAALLTGVALGIGTRWGVFRYPWVVTKLLLVVTVMLVGGFVLNPASNQMLDGDGDATNRLIAGAAYDVVALTTATALGCVQTRAAIPTSPGAELMRRHRLSRRASAWCCRCARCRRPDGAGTEFATGDRVGEATQRSRSPPSTRPPHSMISRRCGSRSATPHRRARRVRARRVRGAHAQALTLRFLIEELGFRSIAWDRWRSIACRFCRSRLQRAGSARATIRRTFSSSSTTLGTS